MPLDKLGLSLENHITQDILERLRVAAGEGPVLIVTHDSPDPDALAAGKALATLLGIAWGIDCQLRYCGLVARAENKAMLQHLTSEWEYAENLNELQGFSAVALVDSQPGAGNNSLPEHVIPDIVIDHHHPVRKQLEQVEYVDVRTDIGATSTMVYQYLDAARIKPDPVLAAAMFYGLQTDTNGLARGASLVDEVVYLKLLSWLDREKLILVEQAGLSRDYYRAFCQGLKSAEIFDNVVVAYLGEMQRPDMPAEMADVLIRLEEARAVLCLGEHDGRVFLSLRTANIPEDAGLLVQRIVVNLGRAGGHGNMAGGQIYLQGRDPEEVAQTLKDRFLEEMDAAGSGVRLIEEP